MALHRRDRRAGGCRRTAGGPTRSPAKRWLAIGCVRSGASAPHYIRRSDPHHDVRHKRRIARTVFTASSASAAAYRAEITTPSTPRCGRPCSGLPARSCGTRTGRHSAHHVRRSHDRCRWRSYPCSRRASYRSRIAAFSLWAPCFRRRSIWSRALDSRALGRAPIFA